MPDRANVPDHIVLAGHTGRLLARAGMTAHTRWEVDQHVVRTCIAATRELGRPVTGPELLEMWEAAHTIWTQLQPPELDRLNAALKRIAVTLVAKARPLQEPMDRVGNSLRSMAATAPAYQRDRLPAWLTDEPVEPSEAWQVLS